MLSKNLVQISYRDCNVRNLLEKRKENGSYKFDLNTLVIGRIDDSIDIIFFHYNNFEEARDKWNRRKRRINYDNLLVKFCDQNECTREDFINFEKLDYNNKIFFTAKKDLISPSSVYVPGFEKKGYVEDTKLSNLPLDITELLNSMKKL